MDKGINGIAIALGAIIIAILTGCSFKVEVGYHGQSGRDDRTQTQLVQPAKRVVTQNTGY